MVQIAKRNVKIKKKTKKEPKTKAIKSVFISLPCRVALQTVLVQGVLVVFLLPYRVRPS